MAKYFSRKLPPTPGNVGILIADAEDFLRANNVSSRCQQVFSIALDEILTNIVSYGYVSGGSHFMEVNLIADGIRVQAEVIDDGIAFNPLLVPDPDITLAAEEREIGGLGLFLVKKLMDRVEYERRNDLNSLQFVKDCPVGEDSS